MPSRRGSSRAGRRSGSAQTCQFFLDIRRRARYHSFANYFALQSSPKPREADMRRDWTWMLVPVAAVVGWGIAMVDSRPGWDDTGITAGAVFGTALIFGALL